MSFWLLKSEPDAYSIDDLQRDGSTAWEGVRNYQARNFLRAMNVGDRALFYHSSADPVGVAGVAVVAKAAFPDPSQFDKGDQHFDPKASREKPRWFCPELRFESKFARLLTLAEIKADRRLGKMQVVQPGSRLSVQPVTDREFEIVLGLLGEH